MSDYDFSQFSCPLPKTDYQTIQMAHGAGGRLSADLIEKVFMPVFENSTLKQLEDQATLRFAGQPLAFSTDSFVVSPIFFPGGNIGELAINGTVNDLCMCGAVPQVLSVGFIIEEGLPIADLHQILLSMRRAMDQAGVKIVTGDTKVVNKGSCDKIFINTTGIGIIPDGVKISAHGIQPGDKIILSGTIADHGMAIMSVREGLSFETTIQSDTASLHQMVAEMLNVSKEIRAMRDPTRGGLATSLNELAQASGVGIEIIEDRIPIREEVHAACEILGIDPLYVANEGKLIAFVPSDIAESVLRVIRQNPLGKEAEIIGEAVKKHPGKVVMKNIYGVDRIIDMPVGEQLPRIC
ncbi:MAG: hydrogenase expression/formation protein HypE [Calditrichaeota bacterium]|nr:hydrogenase expression/formation protein HypE [Calditrichota bacterium]